MDDKTAQEAELQALRSWLLECESQLNVRSDQCAVADRRADDAEDEAAGLRSKLKTLQSRLDQLESQREIDASLDAHLLDNVREHWKRRAMTAERRLDCALEAIAAHGKTESTREWYRKYLGLDIPTTVQMSLSCFLMKEARKMTTADGPLVPKRPSDQPAQKWCEMHGGWFDDKCMYCHPVVETQSDDEPLKDAIPDPCPKCGEEVPCIPCERE